jgi:glycosyltransferase involved in cell wall biosynthesis
MKIVQFLASGGSGYGGAEKVCVELCNALTDRHQVTAMVVRDCPYINRFSKAVHIVKLTSNPTINNPLLHYEIYKKLRGLRPDIVHTHAVKATELVKRVNRFIGLKHLGTKHNDRKGKVFNSLPRVTTISEKAKRSIFPQSGGIVRVIHNGVLEEKIVTGQEPEVFTLLAVGRLENIKGFDVLIRQVAQLPFPFRLLIVGEGPERKNLQSLIGRLGLQEKVQILGFQEDIAQMMHDSHVVVISSYKEGGPRVMVEALLYAPVLISTPVGVVPEFLPEEFMTSQLELGDKISQLHTTYEQYSHRFEEVREKMKGTFLMHKIVRQYEDIYREITE